MKNRKYLPKKGKVKVHFYSLARKCRLASFYSRKNSIFKNREKRQKTKKTRENLGFSIWHLFCQDALADRTGFCPLIRGRQTQVCEEIPLVREMSQSDKRIAVLLRKAVPR